MSAAILSIAGLILSLVTYVVGRSVAESEKVLAEKRRIYEEFLRRCPEPNEAYEALTADEMAARMKLIAQLHPVVSLYASPLVAFAISRYFVLFDKADAILGPGSPPLHPAFKVAAKAHNDIVLEMRRDAFAWSVFAHRGRTRLTEADLQNARDNSL